ncbi:VCBS repeat-containing protein [Flectobacillus roseus]
MTKHLIVIKHIFKNICYLGFLGMVSISCKNQDTLFTLKTPEETGIQFANIVTESEQENILNYEYFYNGGGVAAADFNNDGLTDLYFTGNQVLNALYLNKGEMQFENITSKAGVAGRQGAWKTGVSVVDINADGWLDIYVCYSGLRSEEIRKNQLFINNHNLTFTEKAQEYGLDDSGYSTQASFVDYDLDGDLDCFLINHNLAGYQRKEAAVMRAARDYNAGDKLFRNDKGHFTDVSEQAGIKGNPLGFGLGVMVSDVNQDGFPDIYVTNDYVEDDYLYINQKNGTFKDELRERIGHTSYSSMGVDIADINNDNLPDIFTLDMLPEDNARQKLLLWPDNWNTYQAQLQNGFWHANMRNMLQVNQGSGQFAEIGQLAGVSNTDWSWGTLMADFDLDGYKDIFVSNGLGKDYTNADFIKYYNDEEAYGAKKPLLEHLKQMPTSQTKNYIFRNNHQLGFVNEQVNWGFDRATVASGAVYADLDNDGDIEIITNNLNDKAHVYENQSQKIQPDYHAVKVKLTGSSQNPFAIGAKVQVRVQGNDSTMTLTQEIANSRGFQSSSLEPLTFGIGNGKVISVKVFWPDAQGSITELCQPKADNKYDIIYQKTPTCNALQAEQKVNPIFTKTSIPVTISEIALTNNFDRQVMLPMHYSYTGPKMVAGDFNKDGQMDVWVCGNASSSPVIYLAKGEGFTQQKLSAPPVFQQDAVVGDFNGDQWPDVYVTVGNYANAQLTEQQDQLWLNDGKGNLKLAQAIEDGLNTKTVKASDFDKDGDLDVFVGGHIQPNRFPVAEKSAILWNDGKGHFTKQELDAFGLVTDAAIDDFDQNGSPDIFIVGEWMSPMTLKNKGNKKFETQTTDIPSGWYTSLAQADLDGDKDLDIVLGNLGLNTQIRASKSEPASLVFDDFDMNGTVDFFLNYYIQGKSYPACTRDEMAEQMPILKKKFPDYATFAKATIEDVFDQAALEKAHRLEITNLKTLVLENQKGKFVAHQLPMQAQYAPVYAIALQDFDKDGKTDILLAGNNSKLRLRIGKVDANYGILLKNKGKFAFESLSVAQTGLFFKGDIKSVLALPKHLFVGKNNEGVEGYVWK